MRNGRAHARIQQFLDLFDDLAVLAFVDRMAAVAAVALDHRLAGLVVLHDRAKHGWFYVVPFGRFGLGDGYEVWPQEYPGNALNPENTLGQR